MFSGAGNCSYPATAMRGRVVVINETRDSAICLRADGRRIRQIVLHLVSIAVKFSRDEGAVRVSIEIEEGGTALLCIEDSGVWIEQHEIDGAFEPFVQFGGPGRTREGTGLGLPLTRQLVELHGGSLTLESQRDKGTRALVRFPPQRVVV